jgi:hypothetical protein
MQHTTRRKKKDHHELHEESSFPGTKFKTFRTLCLTSLAASTLRVTLREQIF